MSNLVRVLQRTPSPSRLMMFWACALVLTFACHAPLETSVAPASDDSEEAERLSSFSTWALDRFLDLNVLLGSDAGYVALFARDGEVVHAKTAGYADRESETPMRLDTRFRIASMTKPITSFALMMLYEEGHFQLTDPVYKFIPSWKQQKVWVEGRGHTMITRKPTSPVTLQHLLAHTAGMTYGGILPGMEQPVDQAYREDIY